MNKYRIVRLRYTDNSIYLDLYCDELMSNFELKYCHYKSIAKHYADIKKNLSMCQHNNIRIDLFALIHMLETRRKEINEK